ncbi:MAG: alpha-amylase/4-alpha-glucanotransferase domain-containing protein [Nitrospirota bacterium]
MSKLYLILAIHNHQPVGNFDHVLEQSYRKAYLPFLETLYRHPSLKIVLHYSGNLLTWFEKNHPEIFKIMNSLIKSGRVEMLSGGFYEPVLSAIPERDRIPQIKELSEYIKRNLNCTPQGMWLAERVWEPQMPKYISLADIEYVPVDDHHFKLSGLDEEDLLGYYVTEEEGYKLNVFPGSEKLRYFIPFREVEEIFSYFKEVSQKGVNPLLTMADDGEKFGVWPGTHRHCYLDGWLERFLTTIEENSDWLETTTFREYYSKFYTLGRVYLPTASYREMGEWALPCKSALAYEAVLTEIQKLVGDSAKSLLRGGIWRFFFAKYPESNHIHKRMLQISKKVHRAIKKLNVKRSTLNIQQKTKNLLHELWKGQCNDAYWHGIFGGLYLPHLRAALYRYLLRAEYIADVEINENLIKNSTKPSVDWMKVERADYDCDGFEELSINTKYLTLSASEKGGGLIELSLKKKAVNVLDILTRRPEAYHSKITRASSTESGEPKTIHDQFLLKEPDVADYLIYDNYSRASLIDHFVSYGTNIDDMMRSKYEELGDFINGIYHLRHFKDGDRRAVSLSRKGLVNNSPVKVEKTLRLTGPEDLVINYEIDGRFSGIFAVEFNISLLGSPNSIINVGKQSLPIRNKGIHKGVKRFYLTDDFLKLRIEYNFDEKVDLWHYPVETISLSEQGIERLYQGTAFLFIKKLYLNGGHKFRFGMKFGENSK